MLFFLKICDLVLCQSKLGIEQHLLLVDLLQLSILKLYFFFKLRAINSVNLELFVDLLDFLLSLF